MPALTNVGAAYDAIPASKDLGVWVVNFTGITHLFLMVLVDKIGTGTQAWQLWNVTDAVEVGLINDAAAAGNGRLLSATIDVRPFSYTGVKTLRLRVKSTVGADDPFFYGAGLLPQVQ